MGNPCWMRYRETCECQRHHGHGDEGSSCWEHGMGGGNTELVLWDQKGSSACQKPCCAQAVLSEPKKSPSFNSTGFLQTNEKCGRKAHLQITDGEANTEGMHGMRQPGINQFSYIPAQRSAMKLLLQARNHRINQTWVMQNT